MHILCASSPLATSRARRRVDAQAGRRSPNGAGQAKTLIAAVLAGARLLTGQPEGLGDVCLLACADGGRGGTLSSAARWQLCLAIEEPARSNRADPRSRQP